MMQEFIPTEALVARVVARCGRPHPYDRIDASRTALLVVDMQNYFLQPGYFGEVPAARAIVANINSLASAIRDRKGTVIWFKNGSDDTRESWSVYHDHLLTKENAERRYAALAGDSEGHELWPEVNVGDEDVVLVKKRFGIFSAASSDAAEVLKSMNIDTLLVTGTATNICCETIAREAMMHNYKVVMISDALAGTSEAEHQASLSAVYGQFGDVQTMSQVIESMDRFLS